VLSGQVVFPTACDHKFPNGLQVVLAPLDRSELVDLMALGDDASFSPAPDCVLGDTQDGGDLLSSHVNDVAQSQGGGRPPFSGQSRPRESLPRSPDGRRRRER